MLKSKFDKPIRRGVMRCFGSLAFKVVWQRRNRAPIPGRPAATPNNLADHVRAGPQSLTRTDPNDLLLPFGMWAAQNLLNSDLKTLAFKHGAQERKALIQRDSVGRSILLEMAMPCGKAIHD